MPFFRRKSEKPAKNLDKSDQSSLKRSASVKSNASTVSLDSNGDLGVAGSAFGRHTRPTTLLLNADILNQKGKVNKDLEAAVRTSSRLSKTFPEILHDKDAVSLFIQYMESCKAGHLIRFWLDVESFRTTTYTRLRSQSLKRARKTASIATTDSSSKKVSTCNSATNVASKNLTTTSNQNSAIQTDLNVNSKPPVFLQLPNLSKPSAVIPSDISTSEQNILGLREGEGSGRSPEENHPEKCPATGRKEENITVSLHESSLGASSVVSHVYAADAKTIAQPDGTDGVSLTLKNQVFSDKIKKSIARDAVQIFQKYLSPDSHNYVDVADTLRNEAISKICREDGEVDPESFTACQKAVYSSMEKRFYPGFMSSVYHFKHQVNVLTSGRVYLADIMYNESALFYFMESRVISLQNRLYEPKWTHMLQHWDKYLEQEGGSNLLQFWLAADNFQQLLTALDMGYNGMQAQEDAMVIYDKYISLQATHPIGFDDAMRFSIESNICRETGPLPDCFAHARQVVFAAIEKHFFTGYLQSDVYYRYLNELISTVETASYPTKTHKRAASDASSEHSVQSAGNESVTQRNTYLATDTSHKKSHSRLDQELNFDPALLNPELLWKRQSPGMCLGKVDTLGQFVSEFSPSPDQDKTKGMSLFKKKKEKEKEQEEMAHRVAEMIIRDVTSVTQALGTMQDDRPFENS